MEFLLRFLPGDAISNNGSYLDQASVAVSPSSLCSEVECLFNVPPVKALYSTQVFNLTIAFVDFCYLNTSIAEVSNSAERIITSDRTGNGTRSL